MLHNNVSDVGIQFNYFRHQYFTFSKIRRKTPKIIRNLNKNELLISTLFLYRFIHFYFIFLYAFKPMGESKKYSVYLYPISY